MNKIIRLFSAWINLLIEKIFFRAETCRFLHCDIRCLKYSYYVDGKRGVRIRFLNKQGYLVVNDFTVTYEFGTLQLKEVSRWKRKVGKPTKGPMTFKTGYRYKSGLKRNPIWEIGLHTTT